MTQVSVLNKAQIALYSTLINIMSGMNRIKGGVEESANPLDQSTPMLGADPEIFVPTAPPMHAAPRWQSIQQAVLGLLLWIVLGFAAGFLVGMLRSGLG